MNGLIRFSLGNPRAITVLTLTLLLAGAVADADVVEDQAAAAEDDVALGHALEGEGVGGG